MEFYHEIRIIQITMKREYTGDMLYMGKDYIVGFEYIDNKFGDKQEATNIYCPNNTCLSKRFYLQISEKPFDQEQSGRTYIIQYIVDTIENTTTVVFVEGFSITLPLDLFKKEDYEKQHYCMIHSINENL